MVVKGTGRAVGKRDAVCFRRATRADESSFAITPLFMLRPFLWELLWGVALPSGKCDANEWDSLQSR